MINISQLSKSFHGQKVLQDVELRVPAGELLVVLGESGSGKSVLLRHLIGILKPDRGRVEIDGTDIVPLPEKKLLRLRKEIGYLFQDGALYDFMTVYENVAFPLKEHTRMKAREIRGKVVEMVEWVGLGAALKKFPAELSGGMRKRAALARALILGSKILLCDEPTSGLDPIKSREVSDLIRDLSRRMKCTTVITSHDMKNAFRIADRLAIIKGGTIRKDGPPQAFRDSTDDFIKEFLD